MTAATLPADLPPPPVPGFHHDRATLRLDVDPAALAAAAAAYGVDPERLAVAGLVAVLAGYTGRPEVTVGTAGPDGLHALRYPAATDGELGTLVRSASTGDPADAHVVLLPADHRALADSLVDRDVVLLLGADWTLDCGYDPERYLPAGIARLGADLGRVLRLLATAPRTRLAELPVPPRSGAGAPDPVAPPDPGPPRGRSEQLVAESWQRALGLTGIDRDENFFALGGDSLAAIRVATELRDRFAVNTAVDLLFGTPTVRAAAAALDRARLDRARSAGVPVTGGAPVPRGGEPAPASFSQERIWVFEQWKPGTATYNQPWAVRIDGPLSAAALAGALTAVVGRHDALRTGFRSDGGTPVPVVRAPAEVPLRRYEAADDAAAAGVLGRLAVEPFDLSTGPLVRAHLVRLAGDRHILLLVLHHLASDGRSLDVLLGDLARAYDDRLAGGPGELPAPALSFADVAAWQRSAPYQDALDGPLAELAAELAGAPEEVTLPPDRPRPAEPTAAGGTVAFTVPAALTLGLRRLAGEHRATLFSTLLAGLAGVLHRHTGQDDLVVGTTTANRDRAELRDVVGPVFNSMPIRVRTAGAPTFAALLAQVHQQVLGAFARQAVPFELLVERLAPRRRAGRSPVFQVLLELAEPVGAAPPAGLAWSTGLVDTGTAKLDLAVTVVDHGDTLAGTAVFSTDLYSRSTVQRLVTAYLALLDEACTDPDTGIDDLVGIAAAGSPDQVHGATRPYESDRCLHELIQAQAARTPAAVAVRSGDRAVTYAELNAAANRLARRLRAVGVGPDGLVGLCLDRAVEMVVGILGILKAGGAYVPIEPADPPDRKARLAGGTLVVVGTAVALGSWYGGPAVLLPGADTGPADDLPPLAGPRNLAYVMHTSGSTGEPKGVLVEHRGLVNFVDWCVTDYLGDAPGGAPVFSSFAFDMLVPNLFAPLVAGRTVHLLPASIPPGELAGQLAAGAPYAFVKLTPGHVELLVEQLTPAAARGLCSTLVVGADAFPARLLTAWRALDPVTPVLNEYGPTEASVANCVLRVGPTVDGDLVPIGRPIPNTTMYVLDDRLRPVAGGVAGELVIGGDCVARGYLGRPAETAARFVPDPFSTRPGARLYRTGDRGRLRADGDLEFLGRLDDQVKIDGYRVEPAEVQAVLAAYPQVRHAVAVARTDAGRSRLVGYVVAGPELDLDALRAFLTARLPRHLLPASLVRLDRLPLNANGKLDRAALPAPRPVAATGREPAPDPVRDVLGLLWADVLDRDPAGIPPDADFFSLGGRSLDAVRLMARVRALLGTEVPTVTLFRGSTVAELAAAVIAAETRPGLAAHRAKAAARLHRLDPGRRAGPARRGTPGPTRGDR